MKPHRADDPRPSIAGRWKRRPPSSVDTTDGGVKSRSRGPYAWALSLLVVLGCGSGGVDRPVSPGLSREVREYLRSPLDGFGEALSPEWQTELMGAYRALADGQVDLIAGNSTDGQIEALDLVHLEDDRSYFPRYEAVPIVREELLATHPAVRRALAELGGTIDDATMRQLNYLVEVERRLIGDVAQDFLARIHP